MPQTKPIEMMSRKEEKEWTTAGRHLFLTAFPNPDRIGCPGPETLRVLALDALKLALPEREKWLDHMTCCSPCFQEYYSLSEKARTTKRMTVLPYAQSQFWPSALLPGYAFSGNPHITRRQCGKKRHSSLTIPKDQQTSQGHRHPASGCRTGPQIHGNHTGAR